MSFRSGRSKKRYIIIIGVLLILGYIICLPLRTTTTFRQMAATEDDTAMFDFGYTQLPELDHKQVDGGLPFSDPSPPSITAKATNLDDSSLSRARRINQKYCGADTCRFMLPIAITEQGKGK